MTVQQLIRKLEEIPNKEAEVKIYNDQIIILKHKNDRETWKELGMLP